MSDDFDQMLAEQYGGYASFPSATAPITADYYGQNPAEDMQRLVRQYVAAHRRVLDLGCGAGQTLCMLAPLIEHGWGIDADPVLLEGARQRSARLGLSNLTFLRGKTTHAPDVAALPEQYFDLVISQRGPNLNPHLISKLRPNAMVVQEFVSGFDAYPLKEIFGRRHYAPYWFSEQETLLASYAELELFPVSITDYFYEEYYRDREHFARYLTQTGAVLSNWRLPERPYDEVYDKEALALYMRYNTTSRGIRLLRQRKVFVFRRAVVSYYPSDAAL